MKYYISEPLEISPDFATFWVMVDSDEMIQVAKDICRQFGAKPADWKDPRTGLPHISQQISVSVWAPYDLIEVWCQIDDALREYCDFQNTWGTAVNELEEF